MENFFLSCCQIDAIELKELFLRRYHTLDFMQDMTLDEMIQFLNLAIEKEREEKVYLQWVGMLPTMNKYLTFTEFYDKLTGRNIDTRDADVIMQEIEELHKRKGQKIDGS